MNFCISFTFELFMDSAFVFIQIFMRLNAIKSKRQQLHNVKKSIRSQVVTQMFNTNTTENYSSIWDTRITFMIYKIELQYSFLHSRFDPQIVQASKCVGRRNIFVKSVAESMFALITAEEKRRGANAVNTTILHDLKLTFSMNNIFF